MENIRTFAIIWYDKPKPSIVTGPTVASAFLKEGFGAFELAKVKTYVELKPKENEFKNGSRYIS
jgi:hypothetical protein